MHYKIISISHVDKFCEILNKCEGKVVITTPDGDHLNLKSKLSQLITANVILCGVTQLDNIDLYVEKREDAELISDFAVLGERY